MTRYVEGMTEWFPDMDLDHFSKKQLKEIIYDLELRLETRTYTLTTFLKAYELTHVKKYMSREENLNTADSIIPYVG